MGIKLESVRGLSRSIRTASWTIKDTKNKLKNIGAMGLKLKMAGVNAAKKSGKKVEEDEPSILDYLGDDYSIDKKDATFRFADPLSSGLAGSSKARFKRTVMLYIIGLIFLLIYLDLFH